MFNLYILGLVPEMGILLLQQAKLIRKRKCEESNVGDDKATAPWRAGFFHRYTHRTREDTLPSESVPLCWWILSFGGMTGAESHRRWLMKWLWCSYAGDCVTRAGISGALDGVDGMPSLSEIALQVPWLLFVMVELVEHEDDEEEVVFMAIVVAWLVTIGMTVLSRTSEDSSDPEEEAADEFEHTELTPVVEDAVEHDSMVEFISGSPMSWKEFIELNPLSSSAELEIIISLMRSMFAL